jgi:hypothetical protein
MNRTTKMLIEIVFLALNGIFSMIVLQTQDSYKKIHKFMGKFLIVMFYNKFETNVTMLTIFNCYQRVCFVASYQQEKNDLVPFLVTTFKSQIRHNY